ncbi:pisatin demethylase [Nannizzia gypsea CBS 118893]|uniref:Pisatin demethylase n=1 Tax=Arthroderma gypseum (strain ATCC MYA-4604 / CBS 118893) TaxID=535722 RepID=E4UTK7_ARTGP|nr:pisatin demethylase [Nannizzia gypsea CBS 118893]EFR00716.1 pisatin demethylase [Nannizzia gypsea CBS 118893]
MSLLIPTSAVGVIVLFCSLVAVNHIATKLLAFIKLRHIPGPPSSNFSGWPHSIALLRYKPAEWYQHVTENYGSIAKIAPNLIITSSPEVWMHINNKPGYTRADWFFRAMRVDYRHDHLFSLTDAAEHDRRRKLLGPGFYGTECSYEVFINKRLEELLHLIRSKYVSSGSKRVPVDMAAKVQYYTHDVISTITFGKPFEMLQKDTDTNGYIQSIKDGFLIANILVAFGLAKVSQSSLIGPALAPGVNDETGYGKLVAVSTKLIKERQANPREKPKDMLDSFVQHGLKGDALHSEILDAVVIGSFAPCYSICSVILLTLTNQRVLTKLRREIHDAITSGKAPRVGEGVISFAQVKQLVYLQAVIRESLRMLPPVVGLFPRNVPAGGDIVTVAGKPVFLPEGACIGRSVYSMYRCKETYGQNADRFHPERWLEAEDAKLANMIRVNELIFNHGKYQCMGRVIAHTEIAKTVFELLRAFDFDVVTRDKDPWKAVDMFGIYGVSDFWVYITNLE